MSRIRFVRRDGWEKTLNVEVMPHTYVLADEPEVPPLAFASRDVSPMAATCERRYFDLHEICYPARWTTREKVYAESGMGLDVDKLVHECAQVHAASGRVQELELLCARLARRLDAVAGPAALMLALVGDRGASVGDDLVAEAERTVPPDAFTQARMLDR